MTGQFSASGSSPLSDPDADILKALANGDAKALSTLMDRHLKGVKSMAWQMVGDEMTAEDIAQEVFLKAWKQAPKWQDGKARFSTWLYRVTKNSCYDYLRKKKEIYTDAVPEMIDKAPLQESELIAQERAANQKENLVHAIQSLPERQAMAINLCHYQGMSQKQAADIMEIGVQAYESLLSRGRRNLKQTLMARKTALLGQMGETL